MKITTYPADTAITLDEAKEHLRIYDTSFDDVITSYIEAAQILMFKECSVLPYAGVVTFQNRTFSNIILDVDNIASVVVKYYDTDNSQQTLDSANYKFYSDSYPCSLYVSTEPTLYDRGDAVSVECTISTSTDPLVKQGLKMIVGDFFEGRQTNIVGSVSELSRATQYQLSLISKRIEI